MTSLPVESYVPRISSQGYGHDLQPTERRRRLERFEAADGHVREPPRKTHPVGGPRFSVGVAWLNLAEIVGKHVLAGPASRASELEVINVGEVSRKADARVDEDDMQEPRLMGIQLCVNF